MHKIVFEELSVLLRLLSAHLQVKVVLHSHCLPHWAQQDQRSLSVPLSWLLPSLAANCQC